MLSCNSRRWQGVRGKEWKRSERRKCQESICNEITVRHLRLRINFVFLKVRVCSYIWNMCIVNVVNNEKFSQSVRPRTFHGLPTTIVPNFGYHHARDKSVYSTYLGERTFDLTSHDMLLFAKHYSSTCPKQSGMSNLIWYLWYIESLSIMGYKVLSHKYPITIPLLSHKYLMGDADNYTATLFQPVLRIIFVVNHWDFEETHTVWHGKYINGISNLWATPNSAFFFGCSIIKHPAIGVLHDSGNLHMHPHEKH